MRVIDLFVFFVVCILGICIAFVVVCYIITKLFGRWLDE